MAALLISGAAAPSAWAKAYAVAPSGAVTGPSGEPLPRFASLKAELVYLRRGPGRTYAIRWELRRRYLPVMIIGEHEPWRRVRLHDGAVGWIHRAMLTGERYASPKDRDLILRRRPKADADPVARAEPTFPLRVRRCGPDWCQLEALGVQGWAQKSALWGVKAQEIIH